MPSVCRAGGLIAFVFLARYANAWAAELDGSVAKAPDLVARVAEWLTLALELAGIVAIVLGAVLATLNFVRAGMSGRRWGNGYERYRADLGRAILLGLELLVAADIIVTVAAPTDFRSIGVLALVVLIRTFLSFSLEVEIKGRWPWQESRAGAAAGDPAPAPEGSRSHR